MPQFVTSALKMTAWIISALILICGCASIQSPRVSLVDLRVQEVKPLETTFQVDLRIINPNNFPLTVNGVECDIELNDQKFGTGVMGEPSTIPALGSEVVPVTVYSSMINLFRGLLKLSDREQLTYKVKGKVRLAGGAFTQSFPFESEGQLDLTPPEQSPK